MDDMEKYKLLYKNSRKPYTASSSWVSSKEFVPDTFLNAKSKFIPTEIKQVGTGGGTRTHDSLIKSQIL